MGSSRRQYPFHLIEPKWQQTWASQQTFRAWNPGEEIPAQHPFAVRHQLAGRTDAARLPRKFYLLDMFPYPSGAGLHVGHPEGYTATDILARYRRAQGFNVLHPMGWDSFGLPAEQYAVKTGQHPRQTTEANIANFTRQIKSLGFSYDWSRELATTDVGYFKWTQWIFLKLYNSWFNPKTNRAEPIETLEYPPELQAKVGQASRLPGECVSTSISAADSAAPNPGRRDACPTLELEVARRSYRDSKRLAFVSEAPVNWCPELGTVLANEEVVEGKSEVGGYPVIRKPMRQWMLRITAYAERLLADLDLIDWSDSLKEMQRNWIGRSEGAEVDFQIAGSPQYLRVFTTRPDTLFGATYMVLAPEHKFVDQLLQSAEQTPLVNEKILTEEILMTEPNGNAIGLTSRLEALRYVREREMDLIQIILVNGVATCMVQNFGAFQSSQQELAKHIEAIRKYRDEVARKSDLERTELAKEKTGVFTGAYAINPVNGEKIPIWIADYVLASYGTGAIMAVPAHDERDFEFAKKFSLPIVQVVQPLDSKTDWRGFVDDGVSVNSTGPEVSITGLPTADAKKKITAWLEEKGFGRKTINYKLRDWLFSRQRYWGEPFPIVWKKDTAGNLCHEALPESALPVLPPTLEDYKPTATGEPPLARAKDWLNLPDGSVRETNTMPQWAGSCWYYLRYLDAKNTNVFVSKEAESYWMGSFKCQVSSGQGSDLKLETENLKLKSATQGVDLYVGGTEHAVLHLLYARFWHKVLFDLGLVSTPEPFFKLVNQGLILGEDGQKMSKSRGNVVNPDDILAEYGADAFRLYEMFMGPLQDSKPWSTKGVEGVYRFLGRVWRLFVDEKAGTALEQAEATTQEPGNQGLLDLILLDSAITDVAATPAQLKALHACIKKVTEDLDGMRFNTAISAMMVFVNEAMTWPVKPLAAMKTFLQLLAPFAPHLAEELWARLHGTFGQTAPSLTYAEWPKFDPALLVENEIELPVQVNGKFRDVIKVAVNADSATIEALAQSAEKVRPYLDGKTLKKIIIVPKRMVNLIAG